MKETKVGRIWIPDQGAFRGQGSCNGHKKAPRPAIFEETTANPWLSATSKIWGTKHWGVCGDRLNIISRATHHT